MVDWKKDIKLSDLLARNRDDQTPDSDLEADIVPEEAEQPMAADEDAVAGELDTADEAVPFWKRELTFGRRQEGDEPEADVGHADEPEAETTGTPFWKREV